MTASAMLPDISSRAPAPDCRWLLERMTTAEVFGADRARSQAFCWPLRPVQRTLQSPETLGSAQHSSVSRSSSRVASPHQLRICAGGGALPAGTCWVVHEEGQAVVLTW